MAVRWTVGLCFVFALVACEAATEPEGSLSQDGLGVADGGSGSGDAGDGGDNTDGGQADDTGSDAGSDTGSDGGDTGGQTGDDTDGGDTGDDTDGGDTGGQTDGGDDGGQDDGGDTGGPGDCLQTECADEVKACSDDEACLGFRSCAQECQGQQGCIQECVEEFGPEAAQKLQAVIQCGEDEGCFEPPGPQCGDDECDGNENAQNCPEDCGDGVDEVLECIAEECPEPFEACLSHNGCAAILSCIQDCGGEEDCTDQCVGNGGPQAQNLLQQVAQCAEATGCTEGDGGEDSCAGQCGQYEDGAACQCDAQCVQIGDCCEDYADLCDDPPGVECGDGACEPGENALTCPEDCDQGGDPVTQCLSQECPGLFEECSSDNGCVAIGDCLENCQGNGFCENQCFFQAPPGSGQTMQELLQCGDEAGCLDGGGGPECGNGQCEDGEGPNSCPEDCADGPECGNGQCEPGEGPQNCPDDCGGGGGCGDGQCGPNEDEESCPQDCGGPPPGTCEGQCGQFNQNATCQCDPQCADFGDCCADYADLCGDIDPPVDTTYQCLIEACDVGNCPNNGGCSQRLQCISGCPGADEDCVEECKEGAGNFQQNLLDGIVECGIEVGCWTDVPPPGPICGDGVCEDGEECAEDCNQLPPDQCIYELCNEQVQVCTDEFDCVVGLQCVQECSGDGGCAEQCGAEADSESLWVVIDCGFVNSCLQ